MVRTRPLAAVMGGAAQDEHGGRVVAWSRKTARGGPSGRGPARLLRHGGRSGRRPPCLPRRLRPSGRGLPRVLPHERSSGGLTYVRLRARPSGGRLRLVQGVGPSGGPPPPSLERGQMGFSPHVDPPASCFAKFTARGSRAP